MTPKEVLDMAKENKAKVVDLRFMDFPGLWQHFSVPLAELEESSFEDGFGFDGSSIRGCSRFTPATCWWSPMRIPPRWIRFTAPRPWC